jgi:RIO-like serine/threonine protein kinase
VNQLAIFDKPHFPRARRDDARSSHDAAAAIESSGTARLQAERVLAALRKYPNSTSRELAQYARLDRYEVARRLPELHEAGLVTRYDVSAITVPCSVSGKRAVRWCPA